MKWMPCDCGWAPDVIVHYEWRINQDGKTQGMSTPMEDRTPEELAASRRPYLDLP